MDIMFTRSNRILSIDNPLLRHTNQTSRRPTVSTQIFIFLKSIFLNPFKKPNNDYIWLYISINNYRCGLVALWMASTSLIRSIAHSINQKQEYCNTKENSLDDNSSFIEKFPSVDWIQNTAIINLFSKRGEMFSADNLCALAEISFQQFFHHSMVPNTFKALVLKKNVYSFLTSYDKMVEFFTDIRYHQVMNIFIMF